MKTGDKVLIRGATYQFGIKDDTEAIYVGDGFKVNSGQRQEYVLIEGKLRMVGVEHIKNNKIDMKITNLVKKILDKDTRTLVAAGFINGDLALTDEGISELIGILFLEKKSELLKVAEEKIADEKRN